MVSNPYVDASLPRSAGGSRTRVATHDGGAANGPEVHTVAGFVRTSGFDPPLTPKKTSACSSVPGLLKDRRLRGAGPSLRAIPRPWMLPALPGA